MSTPAALVLNRYANGDTNYITKHDQDCAALELAINALRGSLGTSATPGPYLAAVFGPAVALVGSNSFVQSTAGSVLTLTGGYVWLGTSVAFNAGSTPLDFSADSSATYYIAIGVDGAAVASTTVSAGAIYSVGWNGSAFGAITQLVPVVWNWYDWEAAQTSTALGMTFRSLAARLEYDEALIESLTGTVASGTSGTAGGDLAGDYPNPTIKASVALTGVPTAATAASGTNTTQLATTAFAAAAVAAGVSGVTGGLVYKGTWNATTNTPTITSATGTLGWFYKVATAGTTTIDGNTPWSVGDILLFDGTNWDRVDGNTEVVSVAGLSGVITAAGLKTALALVAADIPAIRYDFVISMGAGVLTSGQVQYYLAPRAMTIASGATGVAKSASATASTGTAVFTLKQNGTSIGTVTFTTSATGVVSITGATTIAAGDIISLTGPSTADATLADVLVAIRGLA